MGVKCHDLAYFAVIQIQIRIFDPDADFDQDGTRYTELTVMYQDWSLFAVKWHYLGYFAVIWMQICIFDPILIRLDPDIPSLL